jgi:hypothetical protein
LSKNEFFGEDGPAKTEFFGEDGPPRAEFLEPCLDRTWVPVNPTGRIEFFLD